jgi:hypothetical protein
VISTGVPPFGSKSKSHGARLPRFDAPSFALSLKKYFCGTWASKTSNKEQATALLGDSEKLAVKHAPANPIPALDHEKPEDFCKVSAFVRSEKSGNILEEKPSGSKFSQEPCKLINESSTFTRDASTLTGNRDILAWDARRNAVNPWQD